MPPPPRPRGRPRRQVPLPNPVVRILRHSALDKAGVDLSANFVSCTFPTQNCCFCGEATILGRNKRPHYLSQVTLFKTYLPPSDGDGEETVETCARCRQSVQQVWRLHHELEKIKMDIAGIVDKVVVARRKGAWGKFQKDGDLSPPSGLVEAEVKVEIGSCDEMEVRCEDFVKIEHFKDEREDGEEETFEEMIIPDFISTPEQSSSSTFLGIVKFKQDPPTISHLEEPASELPGHRKLPKTSPLHKCHYCGRQMQTRAGLGSHVRYVHKGYRPPSFFKSYVCSCCSKRLSAKRVWAVHQALVCKIPDWGAERLKKEFNITLVTCPSEGCGKQFDSMRSLDLKAHVASHSQFKSLGPGQEHAVAEDPIAVPQKPKRNLKLKECPHCGEYYRLLASHIRLVHHVESHTCDFCGSAFYKKRELILHTKRVHTKDNWSCSACSRRLGSQKSWAVHQATVCKVEGWSEARLKEEFNITLIPCPVAGCGRIFNSFHLGNLNNHLSTHSQSADGQPTRDPLLIEEPEPESQVKVKMDAEEKNYAATVSPIIIKLEDNPSAPQTRFPCRHCQKTFRSRNNLRTHILLVHLKARPYPCTICRKRYTTPSNLSKHVNYIHSKKSFPCSACAKKLATRRSWAIHEVEICNVPGWSEERLKTEFNITLVPCSITGCKKRFDSTHPGHLKKHLSTKHSSDQGIETT